METVETTSSKSAKTKKRPNPTTETELTASAKKRSDYELERGKPMPSFIHGITQMRIGSALSRLDDFMIGSEITLELNPSMTPDILIFKKRKMDFQRDEKRVAEMPLTAIEILSGTQGMDNFDEKLPRYFEAGVQSVWLVQPFIKTIAVFLPNQEPQVFTKGELRDPATSISLNLDEIFKN
ncbi:MAG: Uma2 family endonuclease [Chloroherpetonaceae bacterium]